VKAGLDKLVLKLEVEEDMVEVKEDMGEDVVDWGDPVNEGDQGDVGDGDDESNLEEEVGDEGGGEEPETPKATVKWSYKKWCWEEVGVEAEVRVTGRQAKGCGRCPACLAEDCGLCKHCRDKPSRGGRGTIRQKCQRRRCSV